MNYPQQLTNSSRYDLHWQMTNCERFALQCLLQGLDPALSIEIGTYRGGSLQVLAKYSKKVISVDIDPGVGRDLGGKFKDVEFISGDSATLLPDLIADLNAKGEMVGFVLIDGDHSAPGVKRDIESVLRLKPQGRIVILMHDSFNPECRAGMRMADWGGCPHVQWVELDFIPGVYHYEAHDTAQARSMWGGFGCAILEPEPRSGDLAIQEGQRGMFEAVFRDSAHAPQPHKKSSLFRRIFQKAKRLLQKF